MELQEELVQAFLEDKTNVVGQSSFGPRPRGPAPHVPQGLDMMAVRAPVPSWPHVH